MINLEEIAKRQNFNNTDVIDIIKVLRNIPGKNDKVALLKIAIETNQNFKSVLIATYDSYFVYGIKNLDNIQQSRNFKHGTTMSALHSFCIFLLDVVAPGKSDATMKNLISKQMDRLSNKELEVVPLILSRSLEAGFSVASINKACPKLISTFPVQKCKKFNEETIKKITWPAIAQVKEDGLRCVIIIDKNRVATRTGNAKLININNVLDKDAILIANGEDVVLDGELIFFDGDKRLDRKTSNGLGNKAIKNTLKDVDTLNVRFICWDIIPLADFRINSSTVEYSNRLNRLDKFINKTSRIMMVENIEVDNFLEAKQFYLSKLDQGMEGIILKNKSALWNDKRSADLLKFKVENTADLRILEVIEGAGKYRGLLGAFLLESEDGTLEVSCGSGLTDLQREEYFSENMIGKIVEVKYNEVIKSKVDSKKFSLFLPIFAKIREDKSTANKLDELK